MSDIDGWGLWLGQVTLRQGGQARQHKRLVAMPPQGIAQGVGKAGQKTNGKPRELSKVEKVTDARRLVVGAGLSNLRQGCMRSPVGQQLKSVSGRSCYWHAEAAILAHLTSRSCTGRAPAAACCKCSTAAAGVLLPAASVQQPPPSAACVLQRRPLGIGREGPRRELGGHWGWCCWLPCCLAVAAQPGLGRVQSWL